MKHPPAPGPTTPLRRLLAYAVHVYTACGLVLAALAMLEVASPTPDPRMVFLWLVLAVVVDGTDGPLARRFHVKTHAAAIDGRTIDDIVDFLTFTFIPLLLIARMGWVPGPAMLFVGPPLVASVLGFANVGAKDEAGGFFLGFPSYWNIVAFYLGYSAPLMGGWLNAAVLLALAVLTLVPVGFIYPNLAPPPWRIPVIVGGIVWVLLGLWMLGTYPHAPDWLVGLSLAFPAFYTLVSFWTYAAYRRTIRAEAPHVPAGR